MKRLPIKFSMAALLLASAIVVVPTPAQTTDQALPVFHHAPALHVPAPAMAVDGVSTAGSYNWGGYAVTGTDFTSAKGSWTVPTVDCAKSPNAWVSFWVGIDGWTSDTVEQTGTSTWCNKTTATYFAWYEFYPAGSVEISMTVTPGDKMTAKITYSGSEFTAEITDETTGKSFSTKASVPSAARSSAEWVAEAPSGGQGILNLADFTSASFGTDGTNTATDSTKSGTIGAFGTDNTYQITQEDWPEHYVESKSSGLTGGSSFKVTWVEYN
jgi:hypothetical protein